MAVPLHLPRLRPPLEGRSHANAMSCPHYDFMPLFGDVSQIFFSPFLNVFCFVFSTAPLLPTWAGQGEEMRGPFPLTPKPLHSWRVIVRLGDLL